MPRCLSVAQVRVGAEGQSAYLATLRTLAASRKRRGQSLWLFRHPAQPDTFLEFSESGGPGHRSQGPHDDAEAALERRLRAVASYAPGSDVLWQEIPLGNG